MTSGRARARGLRGGFEKGRKTERGKGGGDDREIGR